MADDEAGSSEERQQLGSRTEELEGCLRETHHLRTLLDEANDIVFTQDLEGCLLTINRAVERVTGYRADEVLGRVPSELLDPADRELAREMLRRKLGGEERTTYEVGLRKRDGGRIRLEVSSRLLFEAGQPVGVLGIARDVTERSRLEEHWRRSERMEAIGVLAGGLAHGFNNLLTGILGHLDLLRLDVPEDSPLRESLDAIDASAGKAAQLTAQLLGFAGRGKNQNVPIDIHATIQSVLELMRHTLPRSVTLHLALDAGESHVLGDPGQLQHVLLTLALHAYEALPQGGQMTIRTTCEGGQLVVAISDDGSGMTPMVRDHVFEPFFAGPLIAHESGLALAMVRGVAENHGGTAEVESQLGQGTTFRLRLPLASTQPPRPLPLVVSRAPEGAGRVLVVDDEPIVRTVAARMLRELGYQVDDLGDPEQAITHYRQHHARIDVVLLDMVMPGLGGVDVYRAMREVNPAVRALLTSGYGQDGDVQAALDLGMAGYLPKPFSMSVLAGKVAGVLRRKASPTMEQPSHSEFY